VAVNYTGRTGLDIGLNAQFVQSHDWAAGVFAGFIPAREVVNVNAGYRVNHRLRVSVVATNVLDQRRYHLYGGSVIGRRVLGSVTATF
jgi:outer membrane receptor protein involved in Fe transport